MFLMNIVMLGFGYIKINLEVYNVCIVCEFKNIDLINIGFIFGLVIE